MRFLLDESAELRLAGQLTQLGHDVTSITRNHQPGLSDREVLQIVAGERRVLITNDADFGELVVRHHVAHAGVILFRMKDEGVDAKFERLLDAIEEFPDDLDQLLVVTREDIRLRIVR